MSEKKTNPTARWITGVFLAMLSMTVTGSMWAGALDTRIDQLEKHDLIRAADHDLIIKMNTRQEQMMKKLDDMDKKLDEMKDEG